MSGNGFVCMEWFLSYICDDCFSSWKVCKAALLITEPIVTPRSRWGTVSSNWEQSCATEKNWCATLNSFRSRSGRPRLSTPTHCTVEIGHKMIQREGRRGGLLPHDASRPYPLLPLWTHWMARLKTLPLLQTTWPGGKKMVRFHVSWASPTQFLDPLLSIPATISILTWNS